MTPKHRLHVHGLDGSTAKLHLECNAPTHQHELCHPGPNGECAAREWMEEAGPDNIVGTFAGPPPWEVEIAWIAGGGPQINQKGTQ